jgi:stage V sporulation protein D (sporulation-specific penicillin-binding protein)
MDAADSSVPVPAPTATPQTVELAEGDGIPAPQLLGKTVREVTQECMKMGLSPVLVGNGLATEQSPEPGAVIRRGSRITVQFARASLLSAAAHGKTK